MKSSYEKIPLGKLSKIFSGFAFKSSDLIENPDEAYPVIKIANIQNKKVLKFGSGHLPKNQFVEKLSKYKLDKDDFLVAMTGAGSVGKVGKMRNPDQTYLVNQRVGVVRSDKSKVDPEYLFQVLSHDYYEEYLYQLGVGSGQPNVSATDIGNLEVPYPDIETQRNIASILSAFDDLIENNTRRIEILEEMARLIYREWFVHYRYPGHENDKLVDSGTDLGEIPEGWEVKELGDICSFMFSGGTPLRRENKFWEKGTINWYKTKELWDNFLFEAEEKINELAIKDSSAREFPPGTILMAIYGSPTVGRLGITTQRSSCNQAALGMISDDQYTTQYHLFFMLYELRDHFNSISQGAAQQNISKTKVQNTKVLLPSRDIISEFDEVVSPIFEQIKNLTMKNFKLKETRDLLLPKLISGKLEI